jgi:hypothetical protein
MTDTNTNPDAGDEQIEPADDLNPHRLIFGRELTEDDGTCRFARGDYAEGEPLSTEDADLLMQTGDLDPHERQNDGPPAIILHSRAGVLDRYSDFNDDTDPTSVRLIGFVIPDHRRSPGIVLDGMVATPTEDDGVIPDAIKDEFELLGDESAAREEEHEIQAGSVFPVADELTIDDELCRVWWD